MVDPLNQVPGPPGSGQCLTNRRKVRTDRAVRAAKKDPEAFVEHAACALAGHVVASGSPAGGAVGVEVQPAARAADQRLSLAGDQDPEQPALGAFGRGVEDGAVAVLANRTRGPSGVHRFDVVTAAAPVAGAGSARVPNPAAVGGRGGRAASGRRASRSPQSRGCSCSRDLGLRRWRAWRWPALGHSVRRRARVAAGDSTAHRPRRRVGRSWRAGPRRRCCTDVTAASSSLRRSPRRLHA
jgi:hypothetical protein